MKRNPFLFILVGWILGILISTKVEINLMWLFRISFLLFILIVLLFRKFRINSSLIIVFFGLMSIIHTQKFNEFNLIDSSQINTEKFIQLEILESFRSSAKFKKYKAQILQIDSISIQNSNALLYWNKDFENLNYGDKVWISSKIQINEPPKNPHQFDYAKYLARQKIHYTIFSNNAFIVEKSKLKFYNWSTHFKSEIRRKLLENGYTKESADIIGAMLLGDRTEMDPMLEQTYRKTGVVHILSISGLHIVMIYTIFFTLLYPLIYLPKGKFIRIIFSLSFIWLYAFFVEFQPPVARAALMITIFHATILMGRIPNVYHTLSLSAFLLLIYNPNFLFDVGFQLSFSAVFFIVWLMPIYQKWFPFRNKKLKYCRDFVGTSISAQLGTFPLAAYYFHQSSALFLFGNVMMVPASFLMIVAGFISIFLTEFGLNFTAWIWLFNGFIRLCNFAMEWLASFDRLIFESISIHYWQVILLLLGIISIRFWVLKFHAKWIIITLFLLISFESFRISSLISFNNKKEIIVFHQYKNSIIGVRNGNELDLFVSNLNDTLKFHNYVIKPFLINEKIKTYKYFPLETKVQGSYVKTENLIYWNDLKLGWIGTKISNMDYDVDFLLLMNSPKIKQDSIRPETILILDGNNYPNHLHDWDRKIYRTKDLGAIRITASNLQ